MGLTSRSETFCLEPWGDAIRERARELALAKIWIVVRLIDAQSDGQRLLTIDYSERRISLLTRVE